MSLTLVFPYENMLCEHANANINERYWRFICTSRNKWWMAGGSSTSLQNYLFYFQDLHFLYLDSEPLHNSKEEYSFLLIKWNDYSNKYYLFLNMLLPLFLNYSIIFKKYHLMFQDCCVYFAEKSNSTLTKGNILLFI